MELLSNYIRLLFRCEMKARALTSGAEWQNFLSKSASEGRFEENEIQ